MSEKKLTRSADDRWIAGVCGGLAEFTGLDATLIRLGVVVVTLLGLGTLIVVYLVAWLIMPPAAPAGSVAPITTEPTSPPPSAPPSD